MQNVHIRVDVDSGRYTAVAKAGETALSAESASQEEALRVLRERLNAEYPDGWRVVPPPVEEHSAPVWLVLACLIGSWFVAGEIVREFTGATGLLRYGMQAVGCILGFGACAYAYGRYYQWTLGSDS